MNYIPDHSKLPPPHVDLGHLGLTAAISLPIFCDEIGENSSVTVTQYFSVPHPKYTLMSL